MNRIAAFLLIVAFCIPAHAGNCSLLYRRQAVVVHHGYAQQLVAPVVYQVGTDIQQDAVAEKIAQRVAAKLQAMQPAQAVKQSTGNTIKAATSGTMIAKCSRCHAGDNARGYTDSNGNYRPLKLNGDPINAEDFRRVVLVLFGGEVPSEMQGLVAGLNAETKGAITDEALKYSDAAYAKSGSQSEAGVLE